MGCKQSTVAEPPSQQQRKPGPSPPSAGVNQPGGSSPMKAPVQLPPPPVADNRGAAGGPRVPAGSSDAGNGERRASRENTAAPSGAAAPAAAGSRRPSQSANENASGPSPQQNNAQKPPTGQGRTPPRTPDADGRRKETAAPAAGGGRASPSAAGGGGAAAGAHPPDRQFVRKESLEESSFKDVHVKHIDHSELTFIKVIGEGGFKTVWAGTWKGRSVAVGEFKDLDGAQNEEFTHELEMLKDLQHDNVVRLLGVVQKPPNGLFMVTEYVKRGSLFNMLHKDRVRLTPSIRWKIMIGIARGLWYLHSVGLAHRDMKSDNVLISTEWSAKLTDFGMARKRQGDSGTSTTMAHTMCGTALWMPPEIMSARQYHPFLADVYSCAMVLYEVVARKIPFANARSEAELVRRVAQQKERPPFPEQDEVATPEVISLLQSMWDDDPSRRPRMAEVLARLAELCPVKEHVHSEDIGARDMTPKKQLRLWPEDGVKLARRTPQPASQPEPQRQPGEQQIRLTKQQLEELKRAGQPL